MKTALKVRQFAADCRWLIGMMFVFSGTSVLLMLHLHVGGGGALNILLFFFFSSSVLLALWAAAGLLHDNEGSVIRYAVQAISRHYTRIRGNRSRTLRGDLEDRRGNARQEVRR